MEKIHLNKEPFPNAYLYNDKNQVEGEVEASLDTNIALLEQIFEDCGDIVKQKFLAFSDISVYVVYVDGLAKVELVEDFVLRPLKCADKQEGQEVKGEQRKIGFGRYKLESDHG